MPRGQHVLRPGFFPGRGLELPFADDAGAVRRLERLIAELRGVRQARVQTAEGAIESLRVLVIPEGDPADVANEVRRLVERETGESVEPDAIEILSASRSAGRAERRKLSSIQTERTQDRFKARIVLELGGDTLVGESDAPTERTLEYRSVARATLESLRKLLRGAIDLESVEVLNSGSHQLALVALRTGKDMLVGSALVKFDHHDAVARATLDALNRHLSAPQRTQNGSGLALSGPTPA